MVIRPLLILSSSPGYVAPYPSNAVKNAVGWTQNVEQLDGDEYSPSGAIVTGSTGDLIFAINYTSNRYRAFDVDSRPSPLTRSMTISTSPSHPNSRDQASGTMITS